LNTAAARKHETDAMGERRCIVSGEVCPRERLVRFVAGPDGEIVPDIEEKLPGRGLWVTADRKILGRATAGVFSKAAGEKVTLMPGLAERVEVLLSRRMKADLGLARRAGLLVLGFDNVLKSLDGKMPPCVLIEASDGAADGRRKILAAAAARGLTLVAVDSLSSAELSLALGRENVVHAAVKPGSLTERLVADSVRLAGLRALPVDGMAATPARNERNA
jgi:uncharacterized protein